MICVVPVSSPSLWRVFNAGFCFSPFGYFAPPLPCGEDLKSDPLFADIHFQAFLATRGGRPVGRIAASTHPFAHESTAGYFGYFACANDPKAACALVSAAAGWLLENGKDKMCGPVDLTPHHRLGLWTEGAYTFQHPTMPLNPPYYASLLLSCGLEVEAVLRAYAIDLRRDLPAKVQRAANRAARIKGVRLRNVNFNDPADGEAFSLIHNGAMAGAWGFVPLTPAGAASVLRKLSFYYDPKAVILVEVGGRPAGLCLTLLHWRFWRYARLAVLAVLPRYRHKGLDALMVAECIRYLRQKGVLELEFSLVAGSNRVARKMLAGIEGVKLKSVYAVFSGSVHHHKCTPP